MVKRAVTEAQRRSARISALEERARLRRTKSLASTSSSPAAASRKRGRKRKSLQAVVTKSVTNFPHQEGEDSKHDNSTAKSDQLENSSSPQRMPSKQTLEFVLDVLQRRDTHEIFAQPVDAQEVVGYYSIIKEPMDFGTMRAKLQEEMYTSLEQFERDVFLISSNAMKFNASNTVYYTEARAIGELAQRLFYSLRTEPENFQLEYTRTRRRPGRKAPGAATDSHARVPKSSSLNDLSFKRTAQMLLGQSHSRPYNGHNNNGSFSGPRDGRNLNSSETDRRMTYMPQSILSENQKIVSAVLNAPKALKQVTCAAGQYSDSLMRFVKDLGPTAQMIANKKLGKCPTEAPNSTLALFGMAADRCTPNLSALQNPACLNGSIGSQMPYNFLSKTSAAYKGKMVCTDEGTNSFRQNHGPNYNDFRASTLDTSNNGITDNNLKGEEGANSSRKAYPFGSSKEKTRTNSGSGNMDLLIATLNQIGNIQNGHNHAPSGRYYPLTGHHGLPPNPPSQKINRGSYFTWLLNHPESNSSPGASTSKAAATSSYQNGGGQNTAAPAALNQNYVAKAIQPAGWKQPYGEGPSAAAPSALDQYHAAKAMGWKLPNGEGSSFAVPYALDQNNGAKTVQPAGWILPNGEGSSSAPPYALDQNYAAKTMQPAGWKLPNGEGSSSGTSYALDQNSAGKTVEPMGWELPNGEGSSSAAPYALDQNCVAKTRQPVGWKLPNVAGSSSGAQYALDQNCVAKTMQQAGWKLPNGEGSSSAAPYALDQNYFAKTVQPGGWKLPNGEGPSSAAPFGIDPNSMAKGNQPTEWMLPNRLGLGAYVPVALEQKYMGNSTQAVQTPGWRQLNGQGMGTSAAAAALQQKYMEQSAQAAQTAEWNQPTSWGLPTMCNLPAMNAPVEGQQIAPMQQQSQLASAGETPMINTMNFLGEANSQNYQAQTNAQLLWNRQQSSMNGNRLPDLDLQL